IPTWLKAYWILLCTRNRFSHYVPRHPTVRRLHPAVRRSGLAAPARRASNMAVLARWSRSVGPLLSRIVAALFGGYALAALTSVAAVALPISRSEAVLTGMLASFAVYAGAVVWVFAVRSAWRAWAGLFAAALPLSLAAWSVW